MAADLSPLFLGLFGHPVAQSFSPRIHNAFAAQFGMRMDYQVFNVELEGFDLALEYFRLQGGTGCNVTVPLKSRAFELAAWSSPAAAAAQAANTLSMSDEGLWRCDNTDGAGLVNDLRRNLAINLKQTRICILGAGGAASGVLGALLERIPASVTIANRNEDRAVSLAQRFENKGNVTTCSLPALDRLESVDLVINATSMGHRGGVPFIPETLLKPGGVCYDMNYGSASMPLRQRCDALGWIYSDGMGMLLEQAACSFELWTGLKASTSDVGW
jgi:shikimate dehydrogenase